MSLISRLLGVTALCAASLLPAVRAASMEVGAVGDLEVNDASRHKTLQVRVTYPEADGAFPLERWASARSSSARRRSSSRRTPAAMANSASGNSA